VPLGVRRGGGYSDQEAVSPIVDLDDGALVGDQDTKFIGGIDGEINNTADLRTTAD